MLSFLSLKFLFIEAPLIKKVDTQKDREFHALPEYIFFVFFSQGLYSEKNRKIFQESRKKIQPLGIDFELDHISMDFLPDKIDIKASLQTQDDRKFHELSGYLIISRKLKCFDDNIIKILIPIFAFQAYSYGILVCSCVINIR